MLKRMGQERLDLSLCLGYLSSVATEKSTRNASKKNSGVQDGTACVDRSVQQRQSFETRKELVL
jgi:hypothetical protein